MARIITVYSTESRATRLVDMSYIRWFRMSAALARRGHQVDIATAEYKWRVRKPIVPMASGLRRVPISRVRWQDYDVVKTLFHRGWETLEEYGGASHPFIIAKLGSVVGAEDMPGIYFYGRQRASMFATQERIASGARYVTLLSQPACDLWRATHRGGAEVLLVPGGVDADIPAPGPDPYPHGRAAGARCLFAGTFYSSDARSQPEAHRTIVGKLNELGARLRAAGGRLYVLGDGDARELDPEAASWLGVADYDASWNWLQHADVGIVVSAGRFMHNNESTKIYHYLRAGVPVVSESGFPNDHVVRESGLGFVCESGRMDLLAARALEAARCEWDRAAAVRYILENHTWDVRAGTYDELLRNHFTPHSQAR